MTLRLDDDGRALPVTCDGRPLIRYVYRPDDPPLESPRPYFHPVHTLQGELVSLFRPHDHVWHKGVAWSLPNVGPANFWGGTTFSRGRGYEQLPNNGSMRHRAFTHLDADPSLIRVAEDLDWVTQQGQHWFRERRGFTIALCDGGWVLTFATSFTNVTSGAITLGSPTTEGRDNAGYGGLFWRGPRSFTGGRVLVPGVASTRVPAPGVPDGPGTRPPAPGSSAPVSTPASPGAPASPGTPVPPASPGTSVPPGTPGSPGTPASPGTPVPLAPPGEDPRTFPESAGILSSDNSTIPENARILGGGAGGDVRILGGGAGGGVRALASGAGGDARILGEGPAVGMRAREEGAGARSLGDGAGGDVRILGGEGVAQRIVVGGDELMGCRAPWMGFTGRHDGSGRDSTLVFVDAPGNPGHPTQWFVRSGMYACLCPAPFFSVEREIAPGGTLSLRYAMVIADGAVDPVPLAAAGLEALSERDI